MAVNLRASPQLTTLRQTGRRLPSRWPRVLLWGMIQSSQQWLASMGILSWKWRWSRPQPAPLSPPALSDQMGISLPGTSYLTGSWLSLMGVEPSPGFTGTPMGAGEFSGSGQMPAVRQVPPLHSGGNRPLPNRTTATIASHTAPKAVIRAGYGGVST